jgi:hypothetical protein
MLREFVDMLRSQLGQFGDAKPEAIAALDELAEEAESAHPNQGRVVKGSSLRPARPRSSVTSQSQRLDAKRADRRHWSRLSESNRRPVLYESTALTD